MTPQIGGVNAPGRSLRTARIVWVVFLVAACWFIVIAHVMHHPPSASAVPSFKWILAAVGAADIVIIGSMRRNLLARSQEQTGRGETAPAQASWFLAQILGFATAMSIVLFGFVLSMMVQGWFSTAFFIAGLLLLVSYWPQPAE
jgi:hypothetical protein